MQEGRGGRTSEVETAGHCGVEREERGRWRRGEEKAAARIQLVLRLVRARDSEPHQLLPKWDGMERRVGRSGAAGTESSGARAVIGGEEGR